MKWVTVPNLQFNPQIKIGSTYTEVLKAMEGRYRDKGIVASYGIARSSCYFLVDDFIQIQFYFDSQSKLEIVPIIEDRKYWLKDEEGNIRRMFTKDELLKYGYSLP